MKKARPSLDGAGTWERAACAELYREFGILGWLHRRRGTLSVGWGIGSAFLLSVVLMAGSSLFAFFSGALLLPSPAVGFLSHYGNQCIIVAFPLAVGLLSLSSRRFLRLAELLPSMLMVRDETKETRIHGAIPAIMGCRSRPWRAASWAIHGWGLSVAAWNGLSTAFAPADVYHHDVYDSLAHPLAFAWTRAMFFVLWGVLAPTAAVLWLRLAFLARRTLDIARSGNALKISVLLSPQGRKRDPYVQYVLGMLWPTLPFAGVVFALYATHGITGPLVVGTVVFTAAILAAIAFVFLPFSRFFDASAAIHAERISEVIDAQWEKAMAVEEQEPGTHESSSVVPEGSTGPLEFWYGMVERIPRWPITMGNGMRLLACAVSPILGAIGGWIANRLIGGY